MKPLTIRKDAGFTLLEIIISLALLLFVFGFYNVLGQTVQFTNRGRFDDVGLSVAVEQLEIYRAMNFGQLPDGTVAIVDPGLDLLPEGSGTVTVNDYGSDDSGIKLVEVEVNWVDKGAERDVTLTTLLTNGGVGK